jgi:hypothetical protein
MLWKKIRYDCIKLSFCEKKPDCNLVTMIISSKANVLRWSDMEGSHRVKNIVASTPIAGKSDDEVHNTWIDLFQFKPQYGD